MTHLKNRLRRQQNFTGSYQKKSVLCACHDLVHIFNSKEYQAHFLLKTNVHFLFIYWHELNDSPQADSFHSMWGLTKIELEREHLILALTRKYVSSLNSSRKLRTNLYWNGFFTPTRVERVPPTGSWLWVSHLDHSAISPLQYLLVTKKHLI